MEYLHNYEESILTLPINRYVLPRHEKKKKKKLSVAPARPSTWSLHAAKIMETHLAFWTPYLRGLGGQHLALIHDWHMSSPTMMSRRVPTNADPGHVLPVMPPG